jgi:hypothetical protein
MRSVSSGLILVTLIVSFSGSLSASQRGWVRDYVREHGDLTRQMISCGPPVGIREIVKHTQLTVEGIVSHAESGLSADEEYVYTDYVIDVTRVWRMTTRVTDRPGSTGPSPFLGGVAPQPPGVLPHVSDCDCRGLAASRWTAASSQRRQDFRRSTLASTSLRRHISVWTSGGGCPSASSMCALVMSSVSIRGART